MSNVAKIAVNPSGEAGSDIGVNADQSVILHVPEMRCAGCIASIEAHLRQLPGVRSARVNLTNQQVRLEFGAGAGGTGKFVDALAGIGYKAHVIDPDQLPDDDGQSKALLMRVAVAGFGMMNVMLLSVSVWSGAAHATGRLLNLVAALIAVPVIGYAARPFFANALGALRAVRLNMDVPISLAIILAVLNSLYTTMTFGTHAYFDAALALTFFLLGGRYLDLRVRQKARSAAASLARMKATTARKIDNDGRVVECETADLHPGDCLEIRPGDMVPADGIVEAGRSEVDRSTLNGEAVPVPLTHGDMVYSGDINLGGVLHLRVTAPPGQAVLDQFITLTSAAEQSRNRYTALADRAASFYAPLVHLAALAAFIFWWLQGVELHFAVDTAIAVLIITCPCALGLAVPAVVSVANMRLFSAGILIKDGRALERLADVDTVLFDKTGTLTTGHFAIDNLPDLATEELAVLKALADASHHPYAAAILRAMAGQGLPVVEVCDITEFPGEGIAGYYKGQRVCLGSQQWLGPDETGDDIAVEGAGPIADFCGLVLRFGGDRDYLLPVTEQIRPGIADMLRRLDELGYARVLLTGDNAVMAGKMAHNLGFRHFYPGLSAADKIAWIKSLQERGAKVVMVGDGINDMGAMTQAGIAIAPASARDAARLLADVVLLGDRLDRLPDLLRAAREAKTRIIQNFALAALYNCVAVPVAFAGLATPLLAALAMSASSITVSLNALRVRVRPEAGGGRK